MTDLFTPPSTAAAEPAPELHDVGIAGAAILARLDAIDMRLARVEHLLDARGAEFPHHDAAVADLLQAIHASVGAFGFLAGDVLTRLPSEADAAVREAMIRALGAASPRRLGQLLKRIEGQTVGSVTIRRDRMTRDGTLWLLVPASSASC